MIETLHSVLTDSAARSSQAVETKLVKSDVATPWFD